MPKRTADFFEKTVGKYTYAGLNVTLPDGTRRQVTARTQTEALAKRDDLLKQAHRAGRSPTARAQGQTVADFLKGWIDRQRPPVVRASTWLAYSRKVDLYLIPHLGKIPLKKLATPEGTELIADWQAELLRIEIDPRRGGGTLSATTVRDARALLSRALDQAVEWGLISYNPATAKLVARPKRQRTEMATLDAAQSLRLLKCLRGDRHEALFVVLLALGLRKSEALGLKWGKVDLERGQLVTDRGLHDNGTRFGGLVLEDLKNQTSRRTLPLPAFVVKVLRAQQLRQDAERERALNVWQEQDLVFTTQVGTPINPRAVNTALDETLERARLPHVRVQDLRHSCATLLLGLGIDIKIISAILGHSTIVLTADTYAHVAMGSKRQAADAMHELLGDSSQDDDRPTPIRLTPRRAHRRAV
jgi:integrase